MNNFSLHTTFSLANSSSGSSGSDNPEPAFFEGVGYTGEPVNLYGDSYVFDLSSTTASTPMAALINHDPNQRAGVITDAVISSTLAIKGKFLANDHGKAVKAESKAGFPWQMSIGVSVRSVEWLESGATTVNGRVITAPARICRNCQINEISFVPVGADTNTTARALSGHSNQQQETPPMSEPTAAYKAQLETVQAELSEAQEELKKARAAARTSAIAVLKSTSGVKLSAEQELALSALSETDYAAMSGVITDVAAKAKTHGANLSHDFKPDDGRQHNNLSADDTLLKLAKGA